MDDDPGRLVHDEERVVLEGDAKRYLLGLELGLVRLRRLEDELLPARQPVALRPGLAVDERAAFEHPLGRRARADLRKRREEPVEPLPGRLRGNDDSSRQWDFARDSARSSAMKRIPTPITMKESARLNAGQ
jgi:hypothetical protein